VSARDASAELDQIRAAMQGYDWRLEAVLTFGGPSPVAVQVYAKTQGKRYAKVGPLIFPPDGGSFADVLTMLGALGTEAVAS